MYVNSLIERVVSMMCGVNKQLVLAITNGDQGDEDVLHVCIRVDTCPPHHHHHI